ncbi:endonuclease MutS2 [Alkalibaculum sp. M08DMB]|uniref:Endonuclease MutS2 n=1 Tax=Alkalibaculum sporogenes TaxID=2655001 RepID=A0A6A7KA66_9FIRM|nr:endonuclease MutS2 [Alkalibaculum sporogenes]MPW26324.1 endonuclease MutS2 [Alkalibaculum sporogenes]
MNGKTLRVLEYNKVIKNLKEFAVSEKGSESIESLKPISSRARIEILLKETDEAVRMLLSNGTIPLEGFYELSYILKKAKINSILSLKDLMQIGATLRVIKSVRKYCEEINTMEKFNIIDTLVSSLEEISDLEKEISRCILSEEELADNASDELFSVRRQINRKNQNIKEKLSSMLTSPTYQKYLQDQIITIRQDRYVLPIKLEYRSNVAGIVHDQSSTGATLFIEPMAVVEMNNDLKKLKLQEIAEVERILRDFTLQVASYYDELSYNYETLIQLDVIFAKGKYALNINAVCPKLNDALYFNLIKARHPLIDAESVVASDIYLGEKFNTLVITGPNTGGKTVVLKTVGLMCLMVQTGLFIPVNDQSSICIYENIFADIGDEQSIEQSLSTFSSHMTNIVDIVKHKVDKTLVLLDELGAGTDPTEGAALAMAILDYLHSGDVSTIVTTHYSELKQYAITQDNVENASVEFNVETLSPTYKLLIGIPGKSNAFEISKSLGLNYEIIENSKKYLSNENIKFEDILHDIEKRNKETEQNYYEAIKNREKSESFLQELEVEKQRIIEKQKNVELIAKQNALKILEDANEQALQIIKEMNQIKTRAKNSYTGELEELKRDLKEKENKLIVEISKETPQHNKSSKPFKPGDRVLVTSLNQKGYIIKVNADNSALVELGIMKSKVNIRDIVHVDEQEVAKKNYSRSGVQSKSKNIQTSIDVRGMNSEEVIMDVEKFIDDAYLSNLAQITIIHGKGTGVLRQAIQILLKKNKHVSEFRLGGFHEGGIGATIVTLK